MSDELISNADPTPDRSQVEPLLGRLVQIATGHDGEFLVATVGSEDPDTGGKLAPLNLHVPNDEHAKEGLFNAIDVASRQHGNNCYIGISLMRPGLSANQKGTEKDVFGVLAAATDWDGKNDPATRDARLPLAPMAEVETSPGNFQCWYFFDQPYPAAEAKPVLTALARCTKSDSTYSCDHVFRVPGTLNWPSLKKIAKGRSPVPWRARLTFISDECWDPNLTLDELRRAIIEKYSNAFDAANISDAGAGASKTDFDWDKPFKPNSKYRPLSDATIYAKLNAGGDRSALACGLIRQMAQHGYTPQQAFDKLSCYSTLPVMGHYGDHASGFEAALRADIVRLFTKPMEPPPSPPSDVFKAYIENTGRPRPSRREIRLHGTYLAHAVDAAETALIEQGAGYYQRGDMIVRPGAERLYMVGAAEMREQMSKAAQFMRYRPTTETWVPVDCPEDVARTYSGLCGRWRLPYLAGVINAPTLRADGSILDQPGYDGTTGLLLIPSPGMIFPPIPNRPTRADALAALATLKGLVKTFDFVTNADCSVWLSAVLTAVIRRTLKSAPLHAFNAPVRGAGKGKLADIAAVIATGRGASAIVQGRTEEETEKRLISVLMSGDLTILLDNCTLPLEGDFLCSLLTQENVRARILGKSEAPSLPTNAAIFATGNNLMAKSDMTRRMLRCTIDPQVERPETRKFSNDPVEDARRDRPMYLAAALTILSAHFTAGCPCPNSKPLGSFEQWSANIRSALLWLGEADPCDTMNGIEADDTEKMALGVLLHNLDAAMGSARMTAKEIATLSPNVDEIRNGLADALRTVATSTRGDGVDPSRLGKYLGSHARKIVDGLRLVQDGMRAGNRLWRVERVVTQKGSGGDGGDGCLVSKR